MRGDAFECTRGSERVWSHQLKWIRIGYIGIPKIMRERYEPASDRKDKRRFGFM